MSPRKPLSWKDGSDETIGFQPVVGGGLGFGGRRAGWLAHGPFARRAHASGSQSEAAAALDRAAAAQKFAFVFFWKEQNPQTDRAWGVLQAAAGKMSDWADVVAVQATDPAEKPLVDRFGTSRAPMPLVLAVAPCGAVTKAFTSAFDESQLRTALVSPGTQLCLKALQDRKLVLLCVVDQAGPNGVGVPAAAQEFKADQRFGAASEIVLVSAGDEGEAGFLKELKVDTRVPSAVHGLARSSRQRHRPIRRSGEQGPIAGQTRRGPVEPVRRRHVRSGWMRSEEIGADARVAGTLRVPSAKHGSPSRVNSEGDLAKSCTARRAMLRKSRHRSVPTTICRENNSCECELWFGGRFSSERASW